MKTRRLPSESSPPAAPARTAPPEGKCVVTFPVPLDVVMQAPLPDFVSQNNVEALFGIPPETYLEHLRAPGCPIQVTKLGKLRLVERNDLVAWLRRGAPFNRPTPPSAEPTETGPSNDTNTMTEREIMARMGVEEIPAAPAVSPGRTGRFTRA